MYTSMLYMRLLPIRYNSRVTLELFRKLTNVACVYIMVPAMQRTISMLKMMSLALAFDLSCVRFLVMRPLIR